MTATPSRKYSIPFFLMIWFFIWGICPWNNSSEAALIVDAAHANHGHAETDHAHHASKGIEHSCSGSISFSKSNLKTEQSLFHATCSQDLLLLTNPATGLSQAHRFQKLLIERNTLPKLLTEYYQLYSVYRI